MNFKEKKYIPLLVVIIFVAAFLRFWQLGQNPPSLTWDEAAWGYNAYSLGIDGKDEFGRFLPYDYLESFGDFKPPMYTYLDIIPVKIFGLNEFAVRFPSALLGTLTVLVTYFLVLELFNRGTTQNHARNYAQYLALLTSFLLAVSPWHINLSRAAFEANVASFFIISGVWLFLKSIQDNRRYLALSAISFVLSFYTFNTARIVAPLLIVGLAVVYRKQIFEKKKELIMGVVVGILLLLPIVQFLLSSQASLRFKEVNIFSDISIIERTNQEIENDKNAWWSRVLHNRRLAYGVEYITHYLDNFNPSFLFIKGDGNPKFSTQDVGQLYLFEIPFLIVGILFLFRKREGNWFVIPLWLFIGIVPAATARETPHALRIETTLPTFQILVAYGLVIFLRTIANFKYKITKIKIKYLIFTLCFLFFIFNFLYYVHGYYAHYPREYSGEWQYGYKESIEYVKSVQDKYDQILVTTALGRPYVYYAFFTKTDPETFRKTAIVKRDAFGFVAVSGFLKYRFADNLSSIKAKTKKTLYVDMPGRVHPKGDILKKFYLLNGEVALVAYRL